MQEACSGGTVRPGIQPARDRGDECGLAYYGITIVVR